MLRRLFSRYFFICATIVALTVGMLGCVASIVIGIQSVDERSGAMERAANKIASGVARMPRNYHILAGNIFDNSISAIQETINSDVIIYGEDGLLDMTTLDLRENMPSPAVIGSVLEGNVYRAGVSYGESGRIVGFTVGVPVISGDNHIKGAVFITTKDLNIASSVVSTLLIFGVCGFGVLLVTYVILFISTKQITRPVYEMSEIASQYAKGDFSKRLDVAKSHEYAPLAIAFNSMADGIDNLEQMRRGFVADVSHELRTPMTTIKGFVDGMLDGTIPPELHEKYLLIVSEEVERISRMVSSFLDVARIQSGQMTFVMKPFDIVETTGKALFAFEDRISGGDIDLEVKMCDESVIVKGDSDAIYRVVYNLLDNAIKFTPRGGKMRCILERDADKAYVTVYNSGCGISREDAAHIFERFYKADKSRSDNKKGTGIGLYLVKNIIKEHGEDIILKSKDGEFASFTFSLPLYKD